MKNAAYAWRQAIFWLSFCETAEQVSQVRRLGDEILTEDIGPQFRPAVDGLAHAISGERFSAAGTVPSGSGRRFLGCTVTRHWHFPNPEPTSGIDHPAGRSPAGRRWRTPTRRHPRN